MKRTWISFIILSVFCLWISGCGDDISGGLYDTSVSFSDNGEEGSLTFDVNQRICKAGTIGPPPTDPVIEDFTDVFAEITIDVEEGMPGVTVNSYSIDYEPIDMVWSIDSIEGLTHYYIGSSTSGSFTITCMSIEQKLAIDALITTANLRCSIFITLHCTDDNGYNRDIEIQRTVYIGRYDNC